MTEIRKNVAADADRSLDRFDIAILKILQNDSSVSNVALANKINLSPPACLRRVERLKQQGFIQGTVALLNPQALKAGLVVMIGVVLDRGSRHVPGGQLVQETDHYASVRGARIVLVDDLQARADITASWLARMNWQVAVLDPEQAAAFSETGRWHPPRVIAT